MAHHQASAQYRHNTAEQRIISADETLRQAESQYRAASSLAAQREAAAAEMRAEASEHAAACVQHEDAVQAITVERNSHSKKAKALQKEMQRLMARSQKKEAELLEEIEDLKALWL